MLALEGVQVGPAGPAQQSFGFYSLAGVTAAMRLTDASAQHADRRSSTRRRSCRISR
jgi:hypothetical protein